MKKVKLIAAALLLIASTVYSQVDTVRLSLGEAIAVAGRQSVNAAVALNRLKTSYWEYRTFRAEQLPEVNFTGTLPSYNNNFNRYQQADGSYTYVQNNWLGLSGRVSIDQNIALTGGRLSLNSSLDLNRQLGAGAFSEYMSIPISVTLVQPVFGVNRLKWNRRIEPVRYREAQAQYIENTENVTIVAIAYFFQLIEARASLGIARQNAENADRLYSIATAKRGIGYISESELMQLELSALQAKGKVTEAESNLRAAMFQLGSFLALDEQTVIDPLIPESTAFERVDYQNVLEKAQANNSFAKNIRRRQLEADYDVAIAKGNLRKIDLYATVGYTGKDRQMNQAYGQLRGNQVVEVGVSIPIVDWGKRKGKVKVAESNREVVLSRIRQEEMTFNQDIFLLVEKFNNQAAQLEIARQADMIAEKRYNTSIETFLIGKISVLDLNDARRSKDEAKLKFLEEMYLYWKYYYNLRNVTLFDFRSGEDLDFYQLRIEN